MRHRNVLRRHFHPLLDKAKLDRVRLYDLRHQYASLLGRSGVPLRLTADLMGHKDAAFTAKQYQHTDPSWWGSAREAVRGFLGHGQGMDAGA